MGQSKKALKKAIKSPLVEGDGYTSPAMGPGDPRHRRGPQRASAFGLRYEPTQFEVDDEFRVRLKNGGVTTKILNKYNDSGGGTVVIPAETRRQIGAWRRRSSESTSEFDTATGIETDVMGTCPTMNFPSTEYALWHTPIPPDADITVDWEVAITVVSLGGNGGTFTWDLEVFALEVGYDLDGSGGIVSPDATLTLSITTTDPAVDGYYLGAMTATFPTDTIVTASSVDLFYRLSINTYPANGADTAFPTMWIDYQTEAQTISVT